jgi:hypothetical protein
VISLGLFDDAQCSEIASLAYETTSLLSRPASVLIFTSQQDEMSYLLTPVKDDVLG